MVKIFIINLKKRLNIDSISEDTQSKIPSRTNLQDGTPSTDSACFVTNKTGK